jgi:hypothetical protein
VTRILLVSRDVPWALELASRWAADGTVHAVLMAGAAAVARHGHPDAAVVSRALAAGVLVSVHDEAAGRRGLASADLVDGVKTIDLDETADLIGDTDGGVMWL